MTTRSGVRALAAGAGVIAVLLAGCTSAGAQAAPGEPEWTFGALDEFMMRIGGVDLEAGADLEQSRHLAATRLREELVAACMTEQGFTYVPAVPPAPAGPARTEADGVPDQGTLAFAEQFGFGIADTSWMSAAGAAMPAWTNPNDEHVERMSEAERAAWEYALYGIGADGHGEDWALGGCLGEALEQTLQPPTAFAGLQEEAGRHWERVWSDPRVAEVDAAWASCMIDHGHPGWQSPVDLHSGLSDEFSERYASAGAEARAGFAEREIALAVASETCRAQVSHGETVYSINHDLQRQFVDRHEAELEAWAQYEESRRAQFQ